jgi:beta-lactamase regulating signal transducer with metallopeptidase domain/uncharacterized GH25 family protein
MTLALWLDSSLSTRLCLTLMHSLWQVAAVAAVLAILARRWEALRYNLFVAGLLLCLAMVGATFLLVEAGPQFVRRENSVVAVPPAELIHDAPRRTAGVSFPAMPTETSPPATPNAVAIPLVPPPAPSPNVRWGDFAPLVASCYAVCVLAMLARLAVGATRVNRVCASAEPITCGPLFDALTRLARGYSLRVAPALARSSQVLVPQVVGILKPTILLPVSACTGLSADDLELVLAHELAHVRRHDLWVNCLQRVAESLLFFHPALWYLSRRTSVLREFCCDEVVCRAMADRPRELRCQYASLLVRVAELAANARPQRAASLAAFVSGNGSPSELRHRVARLLGEHDLAPLRCSRGGVLMAAVLLLVLPSVWPAAALSDSTDQDSRSETTFELLVVGPDGQPVPNAVVEIRSDPRLPADSLRTGQLLRSTNYGIQVRADSAGRVIVVRPREAKRFSASIKMDGYGPYWASWDSTSVPRPIPASFTAELEAAWRVGGVVVDTKGDPIVGATVHPSIEFKKRPGDLQQLSTGDQIRSDAAGRWSFASVPASKSEVHVSIDHPNFMPERAPLSRSEFGIDALTEPTAKIVLQPGMTITGTVIDDAGQPIAGALVRAQFHNDIRQAMTAADGTYRLVGCEPRMARIVVSAKGRALDLQEVRVAEGMPPVNFQLKPGGHLRVRVVDEAGNAVPKARIFFQEWRGHVDYFEFDHVPGYADENGVWEWNEAPLDEIKADICRPNGMQLSKRPFQARAEEYVFQTPPALVVTGQVVDAETHEPIENFQAILGLRWANNPMDSGIHWSRDDSYQASDGRYRVSQNSEYVANFVRIEADGYEAAVSREIEYDEGAVKIDFALKRGKDLAAAIVTPGGVPAIGAKLALGIAGAQINVENGEIDDGSTYAARLDVDASGKFSFPQQDGAYQLVITHPTGFAQIDSTAGPIVSPIRLTPWARVEGTFRIGDKIAANVPLTINAAGLGSHGHGKPTIFTQHDATTDAAGRFVFERVVPGRARIGRNIIVMVDDGATSVASSAMIAADFAAGETTKINLGGTGRPIVGKITPYDGFSGEVLWNFAMIHVEVDLEQPKFPEAPADVQNDEPRRAKWWKDWLASEAGQTWKAKYTEYEARRDAATDYRISVAADGTFRIEDMPPGAYVMSVRFDEHPAGSLTGYRFSVPLDDAMISGKPLDLGSITLAKD